LVDQVTADWESLRMNHGIAKEFREAVRSRTIVPSVALAVAACNHPGSCSQSSPISGRIDCDWNDAPDRINCDSDHIR
jgi:hypothetical protein